MTRDERIGGGSGRRGGFEGEVARVMRELGSMDPGQSVRIESVPDPLRAFWPASGQKPIHIQHSTRDYYRQTHPWVRDHEEMVVRAILNPDIIRLDARKPSLRAILYREASDARIVLVVVQQKPGAAPFNRVVTAFEVLPLEVARRERTESLVWRRGKG